MQLMQPVILIYQRSETRLETPTPGDYSDDEAEEGGDDDDDVVQVEKLNTDDDFSREREGA